MDKKTKLIVAGLAGSAGAVVAGRTLTHQLNKWIGKVLMTDTYSENILELFSAAYRVGFQNIWEANLRAEEGTVINRPLGSPRKFYHLDGLAFSPAYLKTLPTEINVKVDTETVIGKNSKKPMVLSTPIIVSGMAYGFALSEQAKYALAKGTAMAGTATNTGEGPWLQRERDLAKHLILQYSRGNWAKESKYLKQADMIEIQLGQGAIAGLGHIIESKSMNRKLQQRLGLKPGEPAIVRSRHPELLEPNGLKNLVKQLRAITGGAPIGIKLSFNNTIETEIDIALDAGVDVLALEGTQAATKGASPILEDEFGLPTIMGLCRAIKHLEKTGRRHQVDVIVSGGLFTPGHFLKVLALGADAVYIGSIALFAMTHTQVLEALPFEPPTQVAWDTGKYAHRFNWKTGATSIYKFIKSCTEELGEGIRALGKTSINDVNRSDLVSLDQTTSEITGIPLVWESGSQSKTNNRKRPRRRQLRRTRQSLET